MADFTYEKVSLDDARKVLDGCAAAPAEAPSACRRPLPAETLSAVTARWLLERPPRLRPLQLARLYPRIANDLCRQWRQLGRWNRYMADLLIVSRDGRARQGFPAQVASELVALNEHHEALFPVLPPAHDEAPWFADTFRQRG